MDKKELLNENSNYMFLKDKKKLNAAANNISTTGINIYIVILSIIEYIRSSQVSYDLFSIFFVSELIKSFYKYMKTKNNLYLLEFIGCLISIIGLFILMI